MDKENKDGKKPDGVVETIGDLNDFINSGATTQAAQGASQAMKDIMESTKKKKEMK